MIIELFLASFVLLFTLGWGAWMKRILGMQTSSLVITSLLGLSLFSIICCLISFFMPIRWGMEIGFIAVALLAFILPKMRVFLAAFPVQIKSVWFWVFAVIVLLVGSYFAFVPDQFGYYVPTLIWLKNFGLVIGTSNVDWSISQMSLFHIMESGLDETLDYFLRINIFIVLLYLLYVFEKKAYLLLLFVPFYFLFIQSLSPDIPVALISLIIVNEICFHPQKETGNTSLIISMFLFAVKPTVFWLLLWILFIEFFQNRKTLFCKENLSAFIVSGIFLLLVLAKNIISSSTLIYPATFPLLNTWWQNSPFVIDYIAEVGQSKPFNLQYSLQELASMSFFQKFHTWLTFDNLRAYINMFVLLVSVGFGLFACLKKHKLYITLWLAILIKMVFTFFFSGQFRFFLDGLWPLLLILLLQLKIHPLKIKILALTLFLTVGIALSVPQKWINLWPKTYVEWMIEGFSARSILVPETDYLNQYKTATIGNFSFNVSTAYIFNVDTPQPAFTIDALRQFFHWGIFPQMKDPNNIRKGFYIKTLSEEEKDKLKSIIKDVK